MEWGLAHISSREISEWLAFAQREPIGGERSDFQAALVASVVANAHRDPEQRREPFAPADFIPDWWEAEPVEAEQSVKTQIAIVELLNAALGGEDLRPHPDPLPGGEGRG